MSPGTRTISTGTARIGLGRYLLGSAVVLLTPLVWLATVLLFGRHDSAAGTLGLLVCSLVIAVAYPVCAFLCFDARIPAGVVALTTVILVVTTVALVAAVWSARLHFA
ncbi:hypothetical protein [Longivirga aurantiaca]|uniref:Integral membrane protein n=1 Tax=Longivirga aurantiaca TaxID=1837743 RepID=A0ABW1T051_9ACTN